MIKKMMQSLFLLISLMTSFNQIFAQGVQSPLPAPTQTQISAPIQTQVSPDSDQKLGERDPFLPPKYIRDMELVKVEDLIDKQMEAIRRWPLSEYKLKGIIWDVKNPKALIVDQLGTLHLLKKNYRIGNREGIISEIGDSEIIVVQKGVPTVIQIEKTVSKPTEISTSSTDQNKSVNELNKQSQQMQQQLQQLNTQLPPQAPEIKK
jgi:Tfp pilus assembly protein PilP